MDRANISYWTFLAEANQVGYAPSGATSAANDLYRHGRNGSLDANQDGTILFEWRHFLGDPANYQGRTQPDCMAARFDTLWNAHSSRRLDPKYHLFEREAARVLPAGWVRARVGDLMRRRLAPVEQFEFDHEYTVMTISQKGEIRRAAGGQGKQSPGMAW